MHTLILPVGASGPVVPIEINPNAILTQALRQARRPLPVPVNAEALVDTGADATCLDPALLRPLYSFGLKPVGALLVNMPGLGGLGSAAEYAISLSLVNPSGNPRHNLVIRNLSVVERHLGVLGYQALIGRDVLDRCLMVDDGPGQSVTLAY